MLKLLHKERIGSKENMELTTWRCSKVRKTDLSIVKNTTKWKNSMH